jgi:hypothetical protein
MKFDERNQKIKKIPPNVCTSGEKGATARVLRSDSN